jgi:hypothetical protein
MRFPLLSMIIALTLGLAANATANPSPAIAWAGWGVLAALTMWAAWIQVPAIRESREGRYQATVFVQAYGKKQNLWAGRYRFRWIANLYAKRVATRMDYLGTIYSAGVEWTVVDAHRPALQRIAPAA